MDERVVHEEPDLLTTRGVDGVGCFHREFDRLVDPDDVDDLVVSLRLDHPHPTDDRVVDRTVSPSIVTRTKYIEGEPMKPATNLLFGS